MRRSRRVPIGIGAGTVVVVVIALVMVARAELAREQGRARGRAQGRHRRRGAGGAVPPVAPVRRHDPAVGRGARSGRSSSRATSTRCSCGRATSSSAGRSSRRSIAGTPRRRPRRWRCRRARSRREQEAIAHEAARVAELQGRRLRLAERDREARRRERQQAGRAHGDPGQDAARDAGGERLRPARAVRRRDRDAAVDPGAFVAAGHRGRDAGRPDHRARRRRGPGGRLRRRRRRRRRCTSVALATNRELRGNDRAPLAGRRLLDAHRPLRDRRPRSAAARCPSERPPRSRSRSASRVAGHRDPARRRLGARRARPTVFVVEGNVAKKGVYHASRASAAAACSSIRRCARAATS